MPSIFSYLNHDKSSVSSLAIGCFDAMHLGHFELINALSTNGALLIIDKNSSSQIVPNHIKEEISQKKVFFINFDEIKHLNAKEFLDFVLSEFKNIKFFVAGYDFCFGKNKQCLATDIQKLSNIPTKIIQEFKMEGISIHSSLIKTLLKQGDIKTANLYLGRTYLIKAKIIKGQGLGKSDFVPTINLDEDGFFLPKEGVYLTKTMLGIKIYSSISFIGHRSTDKKLAIETHILDKDIQTINDDFACVYFLDFIRANQVFDDFTKLKEQILLDIQTAKSMHQKDING